MRKVSVLSLLVVLVMMLAACGGSTSTGTGGTTGGDTTPAAENVTIEALDTLKYNPATITAAVGQPINITMNNTGALQHTFVWDDQETTTAIDAAGGESGTTARTFDAAGTYGFHCNVPGHKEAGMVGTVTIQ